LGQVIPIAEFNQLSLKQAAIGYERMGFRVFPIKEGCKFPPLVKKWPEKATTNEDQITKWWSVWPGANIGVATGQESGLFVVDIDDKNSGRDSLAGLINANGSLPRTGKQKTGGGEHYLFKCDKPIRNSVGSIASGIDIRGESGYIVSPPSLHPNGSFYKWEVDPTILADAPKWILDRLNKDLEPRAIDGLIPEGQRNDALFTLGCSLRKQGKRAKEIGAELFRANEYQCNPPLADSEVNQIIGNVNRQLNAEKLPLFQYRDFIRSESPKDATLRHVLHAVSFYMDVNGKPAYPTEAQLAEDTALGRETICRKLKLAEKKGLIIRKRHKAPGQQYFNYVYMLPRRFMGDIQSTNTDLNSH